MASWIYNSFKREYRKLNESRKDLGEKRIAGGKIIFPSFGSYFKEKLYLCRNFEERTDDSATNNGNSGTRFRIRVGSQCFFLGG